MSWLIRVFIENTRMSHFFSCHCQSLSLSLRCFYLFFYVIARLDRAIYFFSPALNIITCTLNVIAPAFSPLSLPTSLSVITRLDRVISSPLPPIFRMPRSSRSIHLLPTSSQQSCLDFLYSVMPRLFPCHLLSHPPGTARPGNWNSLVPREQTAAGGCCHSIVKTMLFLI